MKLNRYALLATFLLIPATAKPMGAQLRQRIYKACKAINITLPTLPVVAGAGIIAYSHVTQTNNPLGGDSKVEGLPDAPEIVKEFVHENIKTIGINQPNLQIILSSNFAAYDNRTKNDIMLIDDCKYAPNKGISLANLLKKQQNGALTLQEKEKLNLYRAIIQHEGTHLKNRDSRSLDSVRNMALCAANYLPVYNFYQSKILKRNIPIAIAPSIIKSLALIPSGLGKLIMTPLIMSAYGIYAEQRADDGISDDINILQAAANEFRKKAEEEALQQTGNPKHPIRRMIERKLSIISEGHPSNAQRVEKFEQRIAKLKEQYAQKSAANNKS